MTAKVYTVTDLGPGDGGKGGVVHKISSMTRAHTIVKVGGAQGSHGVCTSAGEKFAFSQWGCGTFEGVKTHLSSLIVVSPEGLLNEAASLRYRHGIHDPFAMLTIDRDALCATPYHGIASRIKEMARGNNPRGTIGTGVGEAYRDAADSPELAIRVRDLDDSRLADTLDAIRQLQIKRLRPLIESYVLSVDQETALNEFSLLLEDDFLGYIVGRFRQVAKQAKIVGHEYLGTDILTQKGAVVVESSHGILTDHYHGFHPHTSAIRTLPCFTHRLLAESCFDGQIVNLGVTRAYQIRHGAGPMPTADPDMTETLLPGSHKEENRYQGKVRVGPMDLQLLRYAIEVCGGPSAFDGLAITWFDQIQINRVWHVCHSYQSPLDPTFFTPDGALKVRRGCDEAQLRYQQSLGSQLKLCQPVIDSIELEASASHDDLFDLCANLLVEKLGVAVRMISFGPTERDKLCK